MKKAIMLGAIDAMAFSMTVDYTDETQDVLEFLRRTIDCDWIEIVYARWLKEPYVMVVDEEGALKDDRWLNPLASILYGAEIYGNAVIVKTEYTDEGEDIALLSEEEELELRSMLTRLKN